MTSKLQLYDVFSALIPGVILLCIIAIGFPEISSGVAAPHMPQSFVVMALTILAVFTGHIVQAIASLLEPLLYKTWGSRPSDLALTIGLSDRYFPKDAAERIVGKLRSAVGSTASNRSLFLYAMTLAEADKKSRAASFNASFAYHRAILILAIATVILILLSAKYGALHSLPPARLTWLVLSTVALSVLLWYRCKQRAFYYVREVLMTAERLLDGGSAKDPKTE